MRVQRLTEKCTAKALRNSGLRGMAWPHRGLGFCELSDGPPCLRSEEVHCWRLGMRRGSSLLRYLRSNPAAEIKIPATLIPGTWASIGWILRLFRFISRESLCLACASANVN